MTEGSRVPVGSEVPEAAALEAPAAVDDRKLRGRPRKNSNAVVPTTTTNLTPPEEPAANPTPSEERVEPDQARVLDNIYETPTQTAKEVAKAPRGKKPNPLSKAGKMRLQVQDEVVESRPEPPPPAPAAVPPAGRPKRSNAKQVNYMEDEVYSTPKAAPAPATTGRRRK